MYDLMSIPNGFVVSAQAYDKFIQQIKNKIFPILRIVGVLLGFVVDN